MENLEEQIQRIENKLQYLLKEYNASKKEIHRLQKENENLKTQLQSQTEHAMQLHQKVDAQSFSGSNVEDKAKRDLEKRINTYLKDIDKCLALLHS